MKDKLIKITLITMICMMFGSVSNVFGYECDIELIGDKKEIKPGETVTYQVKVKNINAENGIASFYAELNYDKDIFNYEIITDENSQWTEDKSSDDENNDILIFNTKNFEGTKIDQTIIKISFTAKNEINAGKKTISLSNIVISTGDTVPESIRIADKNVEVTVLSDTDEDNNKNINNNDNMNNDETELKNEQEEITNNNQNNLQNSIKEDNITESKESITPTINDNTTSPVSSLPYTGILGLLKIIFLIFAIGVAIFFYNKNKKWKNI